MKKILVVIIVSLLGGIAGVLIVRLFFLTHAETVWDWDLGANGSARQMGTSP